MIAKVTKPNETVTDITIVDIDVASEEEAQLSIPDLSQNHRVFPMALTTKGPYKGFFVLAVMTFTDSDLPVDSTFSLGENSQHWKVIKKNKAAYHIRFSPDEYTDDKEELKIMLRKWAEKNGIELKEDPV